MTAVEISGSLIVQDGNLLMTFNEERGIWNIPTSERNKGELSADTAERIAEECTGCVSEAVKYRKSLKKEFNREGESFRLQPYSVEIEGKPDKAERVELSELESKDLAKPLEGIAEKIADKL